MSGGLLALLLLWQADARGFDWVWIYRWNLLLGCALVWVAAGIYKKVHPVPAVTFLYFSLASFLGSQVFMQREVTELLLKDHGYKLGQLLTGMKLAASYQALACVLIATFLLTVKNIRKWLTPFGYIGGWLSFAALLTPNVHAGVSPLLNASITGTLIALSLMLPLFKWRGKDPYTRGMIVFVSLAALVWLQATTPWLVVLSGVMTYAALNWRRYHPMGFLMPIALGGVGAVCFFGASKLATGNGRFPVWQLAWNFFHSLDPLHQLFGTGLGSTPILIPLLQLDAGYPITEPQFFMYLHNDWLQILFESGWVGLVLALALFTVGLYKARTLVWRALMVGYGVAMCTNFPLHQPVLALFGIILIGGAYDIRSCVDKISER